MDDKELRAKILTLELAEAARDLTAAPYEDQIKILENERDYSCRAAKIVIEGLRAQIKKFGAMLGHSVEGERLVAQYRKGSHRYDTKGLDALLASGEEKFQFLAEFRIFGDPSCAIVKSRRKE